MPKKSLKKQEHEKRKQEFKKWITKQPCAICGFPGVLHEDGEYYNDPSHIKTRGSGGDDIGNIVPNCRRCHSKMHSIGIKHFSLIYQVDLVQLAKRYGDHYRARIGS